MNSWPLIASSLLMGAAGSIHCVAMCSALQQTVIHGRATINIRPAGSSPRPDLWFHAGRVTGYVLLGLIAGLAGDWLLSAAALQPIFNSVWAALNALLLSIGLTMLLRGRQPQWLARFAPPSVWRQKPPACSAAGRARTSGPSLAARGMLWALLPCGLLYSALALAILAGEPLGAALVMAAFGLGTAGGLLFFQGALHTLASGLRIGPGSADAASLRFSGLLLSAMAAVALVAAMAGQGNPFCS